MLKLFFHKCAFFQITSSCDHSALKRKNYVSVGQQFQAKFMAGDLVGLGVGMGLEIVHWVIHATEGVARGWANGDSRAWDSGNGGEGGTGNGRGGSGGEGDIVTDGSGGIDGGNV